MPLSDYNGDTNFTIGGNSFRKTATSGGKDVYARTGGGSGGSGGSVGDSFPLLGDVRGAIVIDSTIFIIEGDQGTGANYTLAQYSFPDMVLEDIIFPTLRAGTAGTLESPGYTTWHNDEPNMAADWFSATSSSVDIYIMQGGQSNTNGKYSRFTYNRSTRTSGAVQYLGFEDNNAYSSNNNRIVGIRASSVASNPPDLQLTRMYVDASASRRTHQSITLYWDTAAVTPQYNNLPQASSWLPSLEPGPFGYIDSGISYGDINDTNLDSDYVSIAGVNPWTGRVYFKNNGFIDGLEVWQIDPSQLTADNNYVGAFRTVTGASNADPSGKMSYIKSVKMPLSGESNDQSTRNRLDISFDIETQSPSWIFQPGARGDRDIQNGSIARWNSAWT